MFDGKSPAMGRWENVGFLIWTMRCFMFRYQSSKKCVRQVVWSTTDINGQLPYQITYTYRQITYHDHGYQPFSLLLRNRCDFMALKFFTGRISWGATVLGPSRSPPRAKAAPWASGSGFDGQLMFFFFGLTFINRPGWQTSWLMAFNRG